MKKNGVNLNRNSNRLSGACCLLLVALLSACTDAPDSPLRIGTVPWPGYEPLYLARDLGYYEGSQVKFVELTTAATILHALRSGNLEAATLTLGEVLKLMDDGFDLRVILLMDISNGADALLAKPAIEALVDLRGKRVAVGYTVVEALMLGGALRAAGLTAADIEMVACAADEQLDCYSSADAIVTFEPYKTSLLNQGARLLFDSSQIPGKIIDVLVVREPVTSSHQRSLERLLAGYFKARAHLASEPDDAAKRMAVRLGVPPAEVLASYSGLHLPDLKENQLALTGHPPLLQRSANNLASLMLKKKLLKTTFPLKNLPDGRFLPATTP